MTKKSAINFKGIIIAALIVTALILSAGCTGEAPSEAESAETSAITPEITPAGAAEPLTEETPEKLIIGEEELVSFVDMASQFANENGEESAFAEYNKKDGIFSKGDLYIYAYDFEGVLLAHPYQQDKIGTDRLDWTTANGLEFVRAAMDTAENGEGYVMYMYPAPESGIINEAESSEYIPKIGYVKKVNENLWIGSGIYLRDYTDSKTGAMPEAIKNMRELVEETVQFAEKNGDEATLKEIDLTDGQFTKGNLYDYAYDYNCTMLAHPYMPEKIGTNLKDYTGPYGVKVISVLAETAKNGGGYVVFGWENPENDNKPELKLGYVKPVNDKWWVGSGVYLSDLY
ncbi:cache domain-containing protein [Methanoplanus limicola]|uniref:Putative cache sensor protein n=1 Tax=Methanoplanus limicola DSM 2279 TaxID=937775 RepID=H1YYR4_9EURY|nr:cache domain-containing protein [Methanoplanus limicola]EHQ36047.1 putative cache sensor protein [Methanoplanus limicola DSM 2279]